MNHSIRERGRETWRRLHRSGSRLPVSGSPLLSALLFGTIIAGCKPREQAPADTLATAAATTPTAPAMFASAGATDSLQTPESVRYDADLDAFFVSNINGNPSQKDGNGFIVRVDAGNTAAATRVIEGGKKGVTLNAPKGIAIVGDTLWVSDIDAVRAFNKRTGAPIASVDLRPMQATFLNDVVIGPDGAVYVTDTGVAFDASGTVSHPGKDRIFKITGRKPTVAFASDSLLQSPNGIAWDGANGRFVVGQFSGKTVIAWKPGDSTVTQVATGPGSYDGLEVLGDGRVLVTSWADSAVHAIKDGTMTTVVGNVDGPADIGVDTKRNVLAVPRFTAGRVEYFTIAP